ncbi:marine proteobacterial sortase target protein [Desulforhopalus sp. 52FAK]
MKRELKNPVKDQASWDPGNVLLLVYPIVIVCLMLAGLLVEAKGAEITEAVRGDEPVREGSLLFQGAGGQAIAAPKLSQNVHIDISGIIARVTVAQKFVNPGKEWMEATYVFPLPDESMVDHMSLVVGERRITGKIMEKEEAVKTYTAAKKEGKKSSLLLQERANVFTTKVANIGPGEEILVEIEYQQRVLLDSGLYSLRFPMVVGPRYVPGTTNMVNTVRNEDALSGKQGKTVLGKVSEWLEVSSSVCSGGGSDIDVQLTVDLIPGFATGEIVSPYHGVDQQVIEDGRHLIRFTGEVLADRDFVLQWKPAVQTELVTSVFAETIGENQYTSLMLMPPQRKIDANLPREVVFVLDISGSMAGTSILQAKAAISLALKRLQSSDRFNVIVFNNSATSLFTTSRPADAVNIQQSLSFVDGLKADGGTEMRDALLLALDGSFRHELLRQVIFLTDGSVANESELFNLINTRLGDSRLFTVGIGSAPNSYFMSRAATMGRGTFTYVGKQDEVKQKMGELFTKIENPAITNLKISIDKPGVDVEVYPSPLPDLYYGEPLVVAMRSGWENLELKLTGTSAGKTWATTVDTTVFGERNGVATFWARKKIRSLMECLALGGSKEEIRKEVVETALQHHLMSKYTSLVAVDERVVRPDAEQLKERAVKNHLPKGWQASAIYGGGSQTATPSALLLFIGSVLLLLSLLLYGRSCQHK